MEKKRLECGYGRSFRIGMEEKKVEMMQEKKKFVNEITKQARKRKSIERER